MIVKRNLKWNLILFYTWKNLLFYIIVAVAIYWGHRETHLHFNIPFDAITAFSTALAIFLGFKNNNAYDRWWEACHWWGLLVSDSRTWARELIIFVNSPKKEDQAEIKALQKRLIYRQIAYVNALRVYLRRKLKYNESGQHELFEVENEYGETQPFLDPQEYLAFNKKENPPNYLLELHARDLRNAIGRGWTTDYCFVRLEETLAEFTAAQGGCERIKNTPFPRHYSFYSRMFVFIQSVMLPFAFVESMGPGMIPLTVVISFIFCSLDLIGERTEDPFENRLEDVPLTALCISIETNLKEQWGDTDFPSKAQANKGIIF
ncbi:MAG TPA: bestrophin family ion channel [Cyclobacteriaceae bacterium]|nr:bestrophin family ion channel [Cyclobacteriaceae bacterium]